MCCASCETRLRGPEYSFEVRDDDGQRWQTEQGQLAQWVHGKRTNDVRATRLEEEVKL